MLSSNYKNSFLGKTATVALLLVVLALGFSCKKVVDIQSTRLAPEQGNWKKYEDARANLIGIYTLMTVAMVSDNTHWLMGDLRNGDFLSTGRTDLNAIINGRLNATYPVMERITDWRRFYSVINAASLFIERSREIVEADKRYTPANNIADVAQARALRAFAYFYMCRIWGDVPLLITSHDGEFVNLPRAPQDKVLAFATSELLLAAKVMPFRYGGTDPILPGTYYGAGWAGWNGALFTKLSAYAILSHIAAWQGNYIDCEAYTKFIIDNYTQSNGDGSYGVYYISIDDLTENGVAGSPFAYKRATQIVGFGFEAGNGAATANGHIEQLTLASPLIIKEKPEIFVPRERITEIFTDPKDLRFSIDPLTGLYRTNYFLNYNSTMPMFSKIKVVNTMSSTSPDFAVFTSACLFTRLEELTLLRAEALAVLGQDIDATTALNRIRVLREEAPYDEDRDGSVLDAVFAERRRELMGEGWRWYDLVRQNRIKRNNPEYLALFNSGGLYWPVAASVLNGNPLVNQNTYWN